MNIALDIYQKWYLLNKLKILKIKQCSNKMREFCVRFLCITAIVLDHVFSCNVGKFLFLIFIVYLLILLFRGGQRETKTTWSHNKIIYAGYPIHPIIYCICISLNFFFAAGYSKCVVIKNMCHRSIMYSV